MDIILAYYDPYYKSLDSVGLMTVIGATICVRSASIFRSDPRIRYRQIGRMAGGCPRLQGNGDPRLHLEPGPPV